MRVCVLSFQPPATGAPQTQTITGVADDDGPFEGRYFFFQSGYAALDTVTSGGIPLNAYMDSRGWARGVFNTGSPIGAGVGNVCADVSTAGIKDAGSMLDGGYCVSDYNAQLSFGGAGWRHAYISAIASGSFTLTYDQNDRTGDTVFVTVFGGTDLDFEQVDLTVGVKTTATKPQGVISIGTGPLSANRTALTGTGGEFVNRGWDTRESNRGSSVVNVPFGQVNSCLQLTDTIFAQGGSGSVRVTSWADASFTVANTGVTGLMLAVCGADIRTAAGVLTQPIATGVQDFDTGIDARWICFIGNGKIAGFGNTTDGQSAMGWGTQTLDQIGFWSAENGGATVVNGARYLSDSTVLRFATPTTTSTTFDAVASLTALNSDGSAQLDWTTVDSTPREVLWFAIGEAITPPPPPPTPSFHTTIFVRRRLRRSPILWSENQGLQTQVRVNLIAVDMQPGVSTQVETPDAQVIIRASKDGGRTWTSERFVSVGAIGAYMQRLNTWRWGQGRQWVVEVSTSDPVTYNLVNLYIDAEPGTS